MNNRFDKTFNNVDSLTLRPFSYGHSDGVLIASIFFCLPIFAFCFGAFFHCYRFLFGIVGECKNRKIKGIEKATGRQFLTKKKAATNVTNSDLCFGVFFM